MSAMPKVIALCGKICSGKTRLARRMAEEEPAVIFSCDEVMADLFHHDLPDFDRTADELKAFLLKKAAETVRAGATVILDWGFWSRRERAETDAFFRERGIPCEWHGVELSEAEQIELNAKLKRLGARLPAQAEITWFVPDAQLHRQSRKGGGAYLTRSGRVKRIDRAEGTLTFLDGARSGQTIPLADIVELSGERFSAGQEEMKKEETV
jgi:predicted kinase